MSGYRNQTFDDRDTDHLKYEGGWTLDGSYNASHVGDTGTLSSTKDLTASVTFTFPVPAIAFYYYAIGRCCGGLYGICIDCYPDRPNYISIDALNRSDDGQNAPIVLFSMRFNTPGIHEIIIRNENDTRVIPSGNSQLTIDRIDLEIAADDTSMATPSSFVSTLSFSGSSLLGLSQSTSALVTDSYLVTAASPTASPTASPSASRSVTSPPSDNQATSPHPSPIGSIVGGALGGGFVVVLVSLFLFWFCLRRKRKASTTNTGPPPSIIPHSHSPSLSPSTIVAPPMIMAQNSATLPTTNLQYPGRYGFTLRPEKEEQDYSFPSAPSESSSSHSPSPSPPSSSQARREQDAGPLPVSTEEPTLPPEYNQVFSHRIRSSNLPPR